MLENLFTSAKRFLEDPDADPQLATSLKQQLRLADNVLAPFNQQTSREILELPENMLPYYSQSPDTISLVSYPKDYKKKITQALELSPETDISDYLPKIYLIDRTNRVTIRSPWGQV